MLFTYTSIDDANNCFKTFASNRYTAHLFTPVLDNVQKIFPMCTLRSSLMEEMHVVLVEIEICKVEGDIEKMLYNLYNNVVMLSIN